jgi:hypothetical protein
MFSPLLYKALNALDYGKPVEGFGRLLAGRSAK